MEPLTIPTSQRSICRPIARICSKVYVPNWKIPLSSNEEVLKVLCGVCIYRHLEQEW